MHAVYGMSKEVLKLVLKLSSSDLEFDLDQVSQTHFMTIFIQDPTFFSPRNEKS